MRFIFRSITYLVILALIVAAGAWFWTGRQPGPTVTIRGPEKFIGQASALDLMLEAPGGRFTQVVASVEQNGKTFPVFSLDPASQPSASGENADRLYVSRPVGKRAIPELAAGTAKITVTASRPALFGWRNLATTVTRDVQVRLDPPRVGVLSTF